MKSPQFVGLVVAAAAIVVSLTVSRMSFAGPPDADEAREISCLALTIYHEARGESERGKLAVGHVVMNRTRSGLFPADICDVVKEGGQQYHRCQFSWWCDGLSDRPKDQAALRESLWLAEKIYYGCTRDPTAGALWYHSVTMKPSWSKSLGPGKRIDRQVFYRGDLSRSAPIDASLTGSGQCPPAAPAHAPTVLAGG